VPVLLDTTVLIDILRGRPEALARVNRLAREGETPVTCAINVDEVLRGLRPHEEEAAQRLLRGLMTVPLGRAEAVRAGRWRRESSERGVTVSQSDCLIAAAAVAVGARLATGNPRHFQFEELAVEHWPAGA
jgi:predicted nucleic acid-binding protein